MRARGENAASPSQERLHLPPRALLLHLYFRRTPAPKVVNYGFGSHESSVNLCDALRYCFWNLFSLARILGRERARVSSGSGAHTWMICWSFEFIHQLHPSRHLCLVNLNLSLEVKFIKKVEELRQKNSNCRISAKSATH